MPCADKGAEQLELSHIAGRNANWYSHYKTFLLVLFYLQFLMKLNIYLPYNPAILLLTN